jgi:hypothetical protein
MSGTRLIAATLLALVASRSLAQEHQPGTGEKLGGGSLFHIVQWRGTE